MNVLTDTTNTDDPNVRLAADIAQLWRLDNLGIEEPGPIGDGKKSKRDLIAEFEKNIRFDEDGNLMVALPWNGKQSRLASNRGIASKRLEQLVLNLKKGNNLLREYDDILKTQLASGIIETVTSSMENDTDPVYYIPHRVVVKMSSLTTKLRIVLDASSKKPGELSLNDCLEAGPSMLVDLLDILIRSRLSDYLVVADIEKAFHQVRMLPKDRNCTRFLWLKDITKPPTKSNVIEYRFTRIPFGVTSSPFLLAATIEHYLNELNSPIAERIRSNLYVDNVLLTTDNAEEIQDLRRQSKSAFQQMNMNLREFITNCGPEMEKFPKDEIASESAIKLLGYLWDSVNDTYTIKLAELSEAHPTKRQVASRMAQTFDPLGVLSPLLVPFKKLIQDCWDEGIDWNKRIPKSLLPSWEALKVHFSEKLITVPRMLRPRGPYKSSQLLVFSDASKDFYACAVYMLYEYENGPPQIGLLASKSKIKPSSNPNLTIPRLELYAIELGARLASTAITAMGSARPPTIKFFSDSMIALYWILRKEQKQPWVNNRVKAIHNTCEEWKTQGIDSSFHHCPTDQNPADLATRGIGSSELKDCSFWFHGPQFLREDPASWPCRLEGDITCPRDFREMAFKELTESERTKLIAQESDHSILMTVLNDVCPASPSNETYESVVPFRSSNSLSKIVSYTHSFLNCLTKMFPKHKWESKVMNEFIDCETTQPRPLPEPLLALERRFVARKFVIQEHYKEAESMGLTFSPKLNPVLGPDGLWRIHRRVPSPVLEHEAYKLILIHKKHRLARLLVAETHVKNVHLPVSYLVTALRTRYWIQADKQLADSVVRSCVPCQKVNNKPYEYPFSRKLPRFRTTPSTPFQHVGLDYGGPLPYLRDNGDEGKAYVLIYTCLVTRATHIELLPDATSEVYIQGLMNIFSRRGVPSTIYSDNAKTFTLGAKIISGNLQRYVPSTSLTGFLAHHLINFHYITPLAPWQGGVYERIVGITKHQLVKEIGKITKSFFILNHVLVRVENMLNSRPLTPNPREIDDLPVIRPSDFILPTVLIDLPSRLDGEKFNPASKPTVTERRTLAHLAGIDEVLERLWDIWSTAYIAFLRDNEHKPHRTSTLLPRVGQVVLIHSGKVARQNWPLGRIVELVRHSTGEIRAAKVICGEKHTVYERPVNLLVPLEIEGTISDDKTVVEQENETTEKTLDRTDAPTVPTFPIHSKTANKGRLVTTQKQCLDNPELESESVQDKKQPSSTNAPVQRRTQKIVQPRSSKTNDRASLNLKENTTGTGLISSGRQSQVDDNLEMDSSSAGNGLIPAGRQSLILDESPRSEVEEEAGLISSGRQPTERQTVPSESDPGSSTRTGLISTGRQSSKSGKHRGSNTTGAGLASIGRQPLLSQDNSSKPRLQSPSMTGLISTGSFPSSKPRYATPIGAGLVSTGRKLSPNQDCPSSSESEPSSRTGLISTGRQSSNQDDATQASQTGTELASIGRQSLLVEDISSNPGLQSPSMTGLISTESFPSSKPCDASPIGAGLVSARRQPLSTTDLSDLDWAQAQIPENRTRPFHRRTVKSSPVDYTCVVQDCSSPPECCQLRAPVSPSLPHSGTPNNK